MSVLIFLSLKRIRFMMSESLTKVYRVDTLFWGSSGNKVVASPRQRNSRWMSRGLRKDKQLSDVADNVTFGHLQDKSFKRNRAFVVGTRVEIWEVLSDKSKACCLYKNHRLDRSYLALHLQSWCCDSRLLTVEHDELLQRVGNWKCIRQSHCEC